jgi:hypothetical protein
VRDGTRRERVLWLVLAVVFASTVAADIYLAVNQRVAWPLVLAGLSTIGALVSVWRCVRSTIDQDIDTRVAGDR